MLFKKPFFLLLISGTELIKYPGISAAGESHEALRYTAKLDAEFLKCHCERSEAIQFSAVIARSVSDEAIHSTTDSTATGLPRRYAARNDGACLPVSPHGIVSPALITKACLNLLGAEVLILDLGAHEKPNCDYISVRENPSGDIFTENAFSLEEAQRLYSRGQEFLETEIHNYGFDAAKHNLIIAECLVGGTTTALGLITGLGYKCFDMISSSFPDGNHDLKKKLISKGLERVLLDEKDFTAKVKAEPLVASAALGDALQPFITGMAANAIKQQIPLMLAGGTQMLAIKTLIDAKLKNHKADELITIATTPWIVNDSSANFNKLLNLVSPQTKVQIPDTEHVLANQKLNAEVKRLSKENLNQELSLKGILELYKQGHVKEGVGLGAMLNLISYWL